MADDVPIDGPPLPNPFSGTSSVAHWKRRPPYKIQTDQEFGPVRWNGKCQCGLVSYKVNRERPLKAKFCHCRGCQLLHGAPFQWAAIFDKSDVSFTHGADGLTFYSAANRTTEYETPTKVACSYCRTPIMDEGRNVCLLFPTSIDYGSSEGEYRKWRECFEISCHIFYASRTVDIPDGKDKWAGLDGQSERLDE